MQIVLNANAGGSSSFSQPRLWVLTKKSKIRNKKIRHEPRTDSQTIVTYGFPRAVVSDFIWQMELVKNLIQLFETKEIQGFFLPTYNPNFA
jgi:hypothetical protein